LGGESEMPLNITKGKWGPKNEKYYLNGPQSIIQTLQTLKSFHYFRKCNSSHSKASDKTEETIKEILPLLFQGHLLCAGSNIGRRGSCKGDSGGPLVLFDHFKEAYVQIATVQGEL
jgi:hypothetical protein